MEDAIIETPRRGRPPRAETTQTERRRRKGGRAAGSLDIPDEVRKRFPDMDFRWARDEEGRIQNLTENDDWDKVPDVDSRHAGIGKANTAIRTVLLMKPKAFAEEDRHEKMLALKEQERGMLAKPTKEEAVASGGVEYAVPGNKISKD